LPGLSQIPAIFRRLEPGFCRAAKGYGRTPPSTLSPEEKKEMQRRVDELTKDLKN